MKTRAITATVMTIVVLLFFYLRSINILFFDLFIYAISIISSIEIVNALSNKEVLVSDSGSKVKASVLSTLQKCFILGYTILLFPITVFFTEYSIKFSLVYSALTILIAIFNKNNSTIENIAYTFLGMFYPCIPLVCTVLINHFTGDYSILVLLSVFAVSTFTDICAYLVGSICKGKKLCPSISPNKTISGGIGGLIGGIIGCCLTYYVLLNLGYNVSFTDNSVLTILFLIFVGAFLSVINETGDLVESFIKRKVGLKDMGNIFPGHGGMLDRVDGFSFTSLFAYVIFSFVI